MERAKLPKTQGSPPQKDTADVHALDDIAKKVANDALSRRRALKLFGVSLLGSSFLSFITGVAEAKKKKKKKKKSNCLSIGGNSTGQSFTFEMVPSTAAATCLANASATVTLTPMGPVETMKVSVSNMPKNKDFDLFVTQVPNAPFGVSWHQRDLETDANGNGSQTYVGRFSIETFAVTPGTANAPVVHNSPPFPDDSTNPQFGPIHTFHLGLWFNSPADAQAAGCPNTETPFNGEHTAGIQALSTRNFGDQNGPLRNVTSTA